MSDLVVSQTLLKTFQACPRKAVFLEAGWKSRIPDWKIHFGTMFHSIMEEFYRSIAEGTEFSLEKSIARVEGEVYADPVYGRESAFTIDHWLGMVDVMAELYFLKYEAKDRARKWVEVEVPFSQPFGRVTVRGKPDIVELENGQHWLWDHKTKGWYDEDQTKFLLPRDLQTNLYQEALSKKGCYSWGGVVYNIVQVPKHRRKMNEKGPDYYGRIAEDVSKSPGDYFIRLRCRISPDTKALVRDDIRLLLGEYESWCDRGKPPVPNRASCYFFGKPCPYLEACYSGDYSRLMEGELFGELKEKPDAIVAHGKTPAQGEAGWDEISVLRSS